MITIIVHASHSTVLVICVSVILLDWMDWKTSSPCQQCTISDWICASQGKVRSELTSATCINLSDSAYAVLESACGRRRTYESSIYTTTAMALPHGCKPQ